MSTWSLWARRPSGSSDLVGEVGNGASYEGPAEVEWYIIHTVSYHPAALGAHPGISRSPVK